MRRIMLISVLCAFALQGMAQDEISRNDQVKVAFADTLANLRAEYYAYYRLWEDPSIKMPRKRINGDFYRLTVPPTYYFSPAEQAYELHFDPEEKSMMGVDSLYQAAGWIAQEYQLADLERSKKADRFVNKMLLNFYLKNPNMVMGNEGYLRELKDFSSSTKRVKKEQEVVTEMMAMQQVPMGGVEEKDLYVFRPNFWTIKGNSYVHFTQNYISDNWYQGGESTNSLLGGFVLEANFDDKQRIEFENKLEIKIGFTTAPSDTMHSYKTNADMVRFNTKLGVKALKHWYYTLAAEAKTQFFGSYKTNTNEMVSNFLSPAEIDVTLGMDYKFQNKRLNLSLLTSPVAYSFVYIGNERIIDPTKFNVEVGENHSHSIGSKFVGNMTWIVRKNIKWVSKLDYFTTYHKVICNWENTFDFVLTKYLSTKLFMNMRYDDGVTRKEGQSYFQFKELLSFGINYTW